jgi:hypothetical protein
LSSKFVKSTWLCISDLIWLIKLFFHCSVIQTDPFLSFDPPQFSHRSIGYMGRKLWSQ